MPIDNAAYVSELDEGLPSNRDPRVEGAAQIRAIKTALVNTFPNLAGEVTADAARMNAVFQAGLPQVGMVMMFSGSTAPDGWAFCDGGIYNNQITPDLRGRFIMGANIEYDPTRPINDLTEGEVRVGEKDGLNLDDDWGKNLQAKGHALTIDEMPAHSHEIQLNRDSIEKKDNYDRNRATDETPNADPMESEKTGGGKEHTHEIECKFKPGSETERLKHDTRPAWYALSFIMYVGFAG